MKIVSEKFFDCSLLKRALETKILESKLSLEGKIEFRTVFLYKVG